MLNSFFFVVVVVVCLSSAFLFCAFILLFIFLIFPTLIRFYKHFFFLFLGFLNSADVSLIFPRHNQHENERREAKHFSAFQTVGVSFLDILYVRRFALPDNTAYRMGSFVVKRACMCWCSAHRQFPFCTHFPPFKFFKPNSEQSEVKEEENRKRNVKRNGSLRLCMLHHFSNIII